MKFEQFQFVKPVDKYTAELFQDLSAGTHIPSIEVVVRRPGNTGMENPLIWRQPTCKTCQSAATSPTLSGGACPTCML